MTCNPPKRTYGVQKVASSNLVAPTFFRKKPFGEYLEGRGPKDLSTSWLERCDALAPSYREKTVEAID